MCVCHEWGKVSFLNAYAYVFVCARISGIYTICRPTMVPVFSFAFWYTIRKVYAILTNIEIMC